MRVGRGKELSQKRRKKKAMETFPFKAEITAHQSRNCIWESTKSRKHHRVLSPSLCPSCSSLPVFLSLSVFLSPSKNTLKRKVIKFKQPKNVEKGKNQKKEKQAKK